MADNRAELQTVLDAASELNAVNDILSGIGQAPVNSLDVRNLDVDRARAMLNSVNRTIQAKGWTFNIEEEVQLIPDVFSQKISYMSGYLKVLSTGERTVYINRNGYIYDREAKTDKFSGPITVTLIVLKPYSQMPTEFRDYIVTKAARRFNARFLGDADVDRSLAGEEQEAWAAIMEYELDYGNYNILQDDVYVLGAINRG